MPDASNTAVLLGYIGFLVSILGGFYFAFSQSYIVIHIGVAMFITGIIIGIASHPTRKRENMKIQSIIDIVSVRKQASISDIHAETGLDREYIQEVIAKRLISGSLHGYLEDDLFVRDTGARRRHTADDNGD